VVIRANQKNPFISLCMQEAADLALATFVGVTYCAMGKYSRMDVRASPKTWRPCLQNAEAFGARHFVGVTYCAMGKYSQSASAEQWQHCVASLKANSFSDFLSSYLARLSTAMLEQEGRVVCLPAPPRGRQRLECRLHPQDTGGGAVAADLGIAYGLEVVNRFDFCSCDKIGSATSWAHSCFALCFLSDR